MENAIAPDAPADPRSTDVASRIAAATAARRRPPDDAAEVRAHLRAARTVIAATGRARVADIVAEAGLSNDAFYRHFPSKDALVAALSEEATERIAARLARQMAETTDPAEQVRRWVEGTLAQARDASARANVAVLGASSNANTAIATGDHAPVRAPLAQLLHAPFAELGSADPALDAELVTHAVTGRVAGHLFSGTTPTDDETAYLTDFCLTTARHPGPNL